MHPPTLRAGECQEVCMRYSAHPSTASSDAAVASTQRPWVHGLHSWRGLFWVAILPALASCNDGYDNNCSSCNPIPAEGSLGADAREFQRDHIALGIRLIRLETDPPP